MQITVKGKQIDVGDALRTHVQTQVETAVSKYFSRPIDATLTLSREAHLLRADIIAHISRHLTVQAHATATDPYAVCDQAIEHMAKRIRRYKRRIKDDHHPRTPELVSEVPAYVLAPQEEDSGEDAPQPMVVAEMTTPIATLSVSDAVMRLDLGDLPVLMFRHATHGGLNVVYRRADGNIGWIDPQGNAATVAPDTGREAMAAAGR